MPWKLWLMILVGVMESLYWFCTIIWITGFADKYDRYEIENLRITQIFIIITSAQLSNTVKWNSKTYALHLLIKRMPNSNRIKQLSLGDRLSRCQRKMILKLNETKQATLVQYLLLSIPGRLLFTRWMHWWKHTCHSRRSSQRFSRQHWTVPYRTTNISFFRIWRLGKYSDFCCAWTFCVCSCEKSWWDWWEDHTGTPLVYQMSSDALLCHIYTYT